jgi:hypothetical protein
MEDSERELYVYAVSDPGLPSRLRLLGRSLFTLRVGQMQLVVERRPSRSDPTIEGLQEQHAIVVQLAKRYPALLPARFGSTMTEASLRETIARHEAELRQALDLVRGRQQMTVRVFGTGERADAVPTPAPTGTAFLEGRRDRAHRVLPEVETIRRRLSRFVAAERVEAGDGGLRLTVLHLVARDVVDEYRQAASALQTMLAPQKVVVTGPWPAFGFVPSLLD